MFSQLIKYLMVALLTVPSAYADSKLEDSKSADPKPADFLAKVEKMKANIDKTIEILRKQITENQTAPFVPDLYLQLGDLLSQRANAYYYLHMEKIKDKGDAPVSDAARISPVVNSQKEAAATYERILSEYPQFAKVNEVMLRLVSVYHALDLRSLMEKNGEALIKKNPSSIEAVKARLVLGQVAFDNRDMKKAREYFSPITEVEFVQERNLARYKLGLVEIQDGRYKPALDLFVKVSQDEKLENKTDVNKEPSLDANENVFSNLKREALTDSVRAYTEVHKTDPQPLDFYSKVAPTEELFLHSIEKLAYRYISLKKYNFAVGLLRSLSESFYSPEKVIVTYRDVLKLIPLEERVKIPPEEIQFVINKYVDWKTYFKVPPVHLRDADSFFEEQLRDLGTRTHDIAKKTKDKTQRLEYLNKAEKFYLLYLPVFQKNKYSVKMASNLADVYYRMGEYLKSGDFYLRLAKGEFGNSTRSTVFLEEAVHSLQKSESKVHYERIRATGLLTEAIRSLFQHGDKWKSDHRLNFILAKSYYELGYTRHGLTSLYKFIKAHPKSSFAPLAGEMILDYFNVRNDLKNLNAWADRLLALNIPNKAYNDRIKQIKTASLSKKLEEDIYTSSSYDSGAEASSYLNAAQKMSDTSMVSIAVQKALKKSQGEGDLETFFKAGEVMAKSNSKDKNDIFYLMASEAFKIGRFQLAVSYFQKIARDKRAKKDLREDAVTRSMNIALLLRDFELVYQLIREHGMGSAKDNVKQQVLASLYEPVAVPDKLTALVLKAPFDENAMQSLVRVQYRLPTSTRKQLGRQLAQSCSKNSSKSYCSWVSLARTIQKSDRYMSLLSRAPASLQAMEPVAQQFSGLLNELQSHVASSDPVLAIVASMRLPGLYERFSNHLIRVGEQNPAVKSVLREKIKESQIAAQEAQRSCRTIIKNSDLLSPANKYCLNDKTPSIQQALQWTKSFELPRVTADPSSKDISNQQKQVFANSDEAEEQLKLAFNFYKAGHWAHAAALASLGSASDKTHENEYKEILGCSLVELKFINEAQVHLSQTEGKQSLKAGCEQQMYKLGSRL